MIKLKRIARTAYESRDIFRIQQALLADGFIATPEDAKHLWQTYSNSLAANWLFVPEDKDEIMCCIWQFIDRADDEG